MTPEQAIDEREGSRARPVYLVLGDERVFSDRVVAAARRCGVDAAPAGFNVDAFEAGGGPVRHAGDSAPTAP